MYIDAAGSVTGGGLAIGRVITLLQSKLNSTFVMIILLLICHGGGSKAAT